MSSEGVTSPPFPSNVCNSHSLYISIQALRQWALGQLPVIRELVPSKYIDYLGDPDDLPGFTFWDNVGVVDKYTTLTYLQKIRKQWDAVIRQHEDAWDSNMAVRQRFRVLLFALYVLRESFVDPESREHRMQQVSEEVRRKTAIIDRHMREVLTPPELKDEIPDDPDDENWFGEDELDNVE